MGMTNVSFQSKVFELQFVKLFDLTATVHHQLFLVPLRLSNFMFFFWRGVVSIRLKVVTMTPKYWFT